MDLARRSVAGELSELLGNATVAMDKDKRRYQYARMNAHWSHATAGGQGLAACPQKRQRRSCGNGRAPRQYFVLRTTTTWREGRLLLVTAEMTLCALQGRGIDDRLAEIGFAQHGGRCAVRVAKAWRVESGRCTRWLLLNLHRCRRPAQIDIARAQPEKRSRPLREACSILAQLSTLKLPRQQTHWAVAVLRTSMAIAPSWPTITHLGIRRAGLSGCARNPLLRPARQSGGLWATLPGVQSPVVGSNAATWRGFTNSYGQWFDIVGSIARPVRAPVSLT